MEKSQNMDVGCSIFLAFFFFFFFRCVLNFRIFDRDAIWIISVDMEFLLDQILIIRSFIYLFHQYLVTNIVFL